MQPFRRNRVLAFTVSAAAVPTVHAPRLHGTVTSVPSSVVLEKLSCLSSSSSSSSLSSSSSSSWSQSLSLLLSLSLSLSWTNRSRAAARPHAAGLRATRCRARAAAAKQLLMLFPRPYTAGPRHTLQGRASSPRSRYRAAAWFD